MFSRLEGLSSRGVVFDPHQLGVFVADPGAAVFQDIQAAVWANFEVHGAHEGHAGAETLHSKPAIRSFSDFVILIKVHREDPVPGPFIDEKSPIKFFGQPMGRGRTFVESVDRACAGGAASVADFGEAGRGSVRVPDEGGLSRWELSGARVQA